MIPLEQLKKINQICPGFTLYNIGGEVNKGVIAYDSIQGGGAIAVAYTRYIEFKQTFSPVPAQTDYQLTGNENGTLLNSTWDADNIVPLDGVVVTGIDDKPIYDSSIPFIRNLITGTVNSAGLVSLNYVPNGDFIIRYKYKLADGVYVDNYDPEDVLRPNEYDIEMLGTKIIATPETPANYTPVQTGSEGDDKLSAHLKGIDNALTGGGGSVNSVNGETGDVILDADDIDDSSTTNKFTTNAEMTAIQDAIDGKENIIDPKNSAFNKDFGVVADTVCEGNDTRLLRKFNTQIQKRGAFGSGGWYDILNNGSVSFASGGWNGWTSGHPIIIPFDAKITKLFIGFSAASFDWLSSAGNLFLDIGISENLYNSTVNNRVIRAELEGNFTGGSASANTYLFIISEDKITELTGVNLFDQGKLLSFSFTTGASTPGRIYNITNAYHGIEFTEVVS